MFDECPIQANAHRHSWLNRVFFFFFKSGNIRSYEVLVPVAAEPRLKMLKSKLKAILPRRNNVQKGSDISPRPKPSTPNIAAQLSSPSPASSGATLAGRPSLVSTAIENGTN
jgi:hypothetical protein